MAKKRTKRTPARATPRVEPEQPKKAPRDAIIRVTVDLPGEEQMEFGFSIKNARDAIPRPKWNQIAWQRAIHDGLKREYGGQLKVTL